MAREDIEDWIAEELADDAAKALKAGTGTLESARLERGCFVSYDEPLENAISDAMCEDAVLPLAIAALLKACATDEKLCRAFADQFGRTNATGVGVLRGVIHLGPIEPPDDDAKTYFGSVPTEALRVMS